MKERENYCADSKRHYHPTRSPLVRLSICLTVLGHEGESISRCGKEQLRPLACFVHCTFSLAAKRALNREHQSGNEWKSFRRFSSDQEQQPAFSLQRSSRSL